jgi:hypothetical protein
VRLLRLDDDDDGGPLLRKSMLQRDQRIRDLLQCEGLNSHSSNERASVTNYCIDFTSSFWKLFVVVVVAAAAASSYDMMLWFIVSRTRS